MPGSHATDIAVIGAGPVGLFQVFEAGMLGMRCHVIDTLDATGGQCVALYPEKPIYDIPGYPRIDAGDLIARLDEQARPFEPAFHLGEQVVALSGAPGAMTVATSKDTRIACKAIVIAAGGGAFGPNRPPLAGLGAYEASGDVAYLVTRREDHRGKRIVIAGGGDSALDWVLTLAPIAEHVMLVHRRRKFRAAPQTVRRVTALVEAGGVELVVPYQLGALEGRDGRLEAVLAVDLDGRERRLEADLLLPFYGLSMALGPSPPGASISTGI